MLVMGDMQCNTVMEGKDTIRAMKKLAGDKLQIMAGGGVDCGQHPRACAVHGHQGGPRKWWGLIVRVRNSP